MIRRRKNNTVERVGGYQKVNDIPAPTPSSGTRVVGEPAAGVKNGSNVTFTTVYSFIPESVEVFVNGVRQKNLGFVTVGGNTVELVVAPLASDIVETNYTRL